MHPNSTREAHFPARQRAPRTLSQLVTIACLASLFFSPHTALAARPGNVTHVVIFWLKRPGNVEDRAVLARASEKFRKMPGVLRVDVGHAIPVRRAGLEQSFDLSVVFTFADRAALERFEQDPRHTAAVRAILKPLVKRYIVFNAVSD